MSLFKKIVAIFMFSLIAIPMFSFAASPGDKSIVPSSTSSPSPRVQPPAAPVPTPTPTPEPNPTPKPDPNPKPEPEPKPIPSKQPTPSKPEPIKFALTFDDGPNPNYTPQVLEILDKFGAKGTFFMVGNNFTQYTKLVQQVTASGNEIAAHSMTHPDPDDLYDSQLDYEITSSVTMLREASNKPVSYFRPPYGISNYIYKQRASELGIKIVYWTVDPRDWSGISSDLIAERVLDKLEPGCIVILHDGGGNRQQTVDALETILREANARGYNSVTLSELGI